MSVVFYNTQGLANLVKHKGHLEAINPDTGEISDKRVWLVNNQIVFTDDGFKTTKTVLGEFSVNGQIYYGLLAEAVIAGFVEGSSIVGGTIKIGEQPNGSYAFEVHADGTVSMGRGSSIAGYAKEEDVNNKINEVKNSAPIISDTQPSEATNGQLWLDTSTTPYKLRIYTNGVWVYFDQQSGGKVFTSEPQTGEYSQGDIWILDAIYTINGTTYPQGTVLKANANLVWEDVMPKVTSTISNIDQYFEFNPSNGLKIGQDDEKFYVQIKSHRMSFYDKSNEEDTGEQERDPDEVVYISNKSAVMKRLVVEGSSTFEQSATFNDELTMNKTVDSGSYSFSWQIESNGSYSLVKN